MFIKFRYAVRHARDIVGLEVDPEADVGFIKDRIFRFMRLGRINIYSLSGVRLPNGFLPVQAGFSTLGVTFGDETKLINGRFPDAPEDSSSDSEEEEEEDSEEEEERSLQRKIRRFEEEEEEEKEEEEEEEEEEEKKKPRKSIEKK